MSIYTLTGAKRSKGVLDDGTPYDSTKVYVLVKMDEKNPDQAGFATSEFNWGTSDNYPLIKDLTYPVEAQVDFDFVTNGKTQKMVIKNIKPLTNKP